LIGQGRLSSMGYSDRGICPFSNHSEHQLPSSLSIWGALCRREAFRSTRH
jgi:hypothetical protein